MMTTTAPESSSDDYRQSLFDDFETGLVQAFRLVERDSTTKAATKPVDQYDKVEKIGQGTFGEVFKVRHKTTKQYYALKRIRMEQEKEGFPITALREIRILQSLNNENIVSLREICHSAPSTKNGYRPEFFLVFDFCDHDLAGLLSNQHIQFTLPQKKSIMKQLFSGLYYLHKNNVLHRDLKAANILIDKNGVLKIADFGLARLTVASTRSDKPTKYTGRVVTLWYRPPEILLNDRNYGRPVDMWGAGCIMAELWTKYPIMQGENEANQLLLITNLCGSITPDVWPGVEKLEQYQTLNISKDNKRHVKEKLTPKIQCSTAIDLIDKLLVLDPSKRIDADTALTHDFFFEDPPAGDLKALSKSGLSYFEFLAPANSRNRAPPAPAMVCGDGGRGVGGAGVPGRPSCGQGQGAGAGGQGGIGNRRGPPIDDSSMHFDRIY